MSTSLPKLVLLVRHGATEWSETGQHTGRTDVPLTEKGQTQAAEVGPLLTRLLAGANPRVFSSPLSRARQTAALAMPGAQPVLDSNLLEYDYGQYEGLTTTQILEKSPAFDLFGSGCPGGETPEQVAARCDAFNARLLRECAGESVVVFTHGHLSRVLTARLLGLPTATAAALFNETASIGMINVHRGRWVLVGWNVRVHHHA